MGMREEAAGPLARAGKYDMGGRDWEPGAAGALNPMIIVTRLFGGKCICGS